MLAECQAKNPFLINVVERRNGLNTLESRKSHFCFHGLFRYPGAFPITSRRRSLKVLLESAVGKVRIAERPNPL